MPAGLSVTPADTHSNPAVISVRDIGTVPIRVTTSNLILHAHCVMTTTGVITVSPASFTLKSGQVKKVHVHVVSSAGDYGVLFSAHPVKIAPGQDIAVGAVGSQILVGKDTQPCVHPKAVAQSSAGIPLMPVAFGIGAVVLVLLAIIALAVRRQHRRNVALAEKYMTR